MEINKSLNQGKMYWGVMPLPSGAELIGTVTRDHQTGALIRLSTGIYVQGNAGGIRTLDQHAITAAIDAYKFGRPKIYDDPLDKVTIRITASQRDWLESKPDSLGAVMRALIDKAMAEESVTIPVDAS